MAANACRLYARLLILAGLVLWATTAPARAENPRISLKVVGATPAEAVAQLSGASGIRIDLASVPAFGGAGALVEERVSFDWTNTTFARALRQFCEKYNLRPSRRPGG